MNDLFGGSGDMSSGRSIEGKRFGVNLATVTDINDPDALGRVKCKFITADEDIDETEWAFIASPFAGKNYGMFFHPRVGDVVLLAFEEGDINEPFVIGNIWWKDSEIDNTSPVKIDDNNKESNIYKITTPIGHVITLVDTKDEEKIEILTADGSTFRLDDANKKIEMLSKGGDGITLDTEQSVLSIKCKEFKVDADGNTFNLSAQGATIDTKAAVSVKGGSTVTVEGSGNTTVKGAALNLESSGMTAVKGSMVKIG